MYFVEAIPRDFGRFWSVRNFIRGIVFLLGVQVARLLLRRVWVLTVGADRCIYQRFPNCDATHLSSAQERKLSLVVALFLHGGLAGILGGRLDASFPNVRA